MHATQSIWKQLETPDHYPKLERDLIVDVAIVGGGITGLTAAVLLAEAGKKVALFEGQRLGSGTSFDTTGHLTQVLDERYFTLEKHFGRDATQLVARSVAESIDKIEALAKASQSPCGFERVDGVLFTEKQSQRDELGGELEAFLRAGLKASFVQSTSLPFRINAAMRVEHQAQISITPYLAGLADLFTAAGGTIYEKTRVIRFEDGEPCQLHTADGRTIVAGKVVVATHSPLNLVFLQTKISHYQSYVISGPGKRGPEGLFWDMEDPYHYIRSVLVDGHRELIIGGADHKTGSGDPHGAFEDLANYAARFAVTPTHRWSHQVVEPVDGLPYIGRNSNSQHTFVATGYSGNGLTFGTLAAMILSDACLDIPNAYSELYAATRITPRASLPDYVKENVSFPYHRLTDPLRGSEARSADEIAPGEGKIMRVKGERLAVYRNDEGALLAVSAKCPHLGCHVAFNSEEKTWDCPCHGSRFKPDGSIVDGPSLAPLEPKLLPD